MKIFLLGAAGNAGQRILRAALARAHEVTAMVRNDADVIAKLRVITQRVRLGSDVLESLERLQHQVEQYAISEKL